MRHSFDALDEGPLNQFLFLIDDHHNLVHQSPLFGKRLQFLQGGVRETMRTLIASRQLADSVEQSPADFANHVLGWLAQVPEEHYDCRTRSLARADFPIDAALLLAGKCDVEILKQIPKGAHRNQVAARAEPALTSLQTQRDRF